MVGVHSYGFTINIGVEVTNGPHNGYRLKIGDAIVPFGWRLANPTG